MTRFFIAQGRVLSDGAEVGSESETSSERTGAFFLAYESNPLLSETKDQN